jgi:hypothetical protein
MVALLVALLAIKHGLADGPFQKAYQYLNKGKYGHPGGILHSSIHAGLTLIVVLGWMAMAGKVVIPLAIASAVFDFVAHYHFDWLKPNITKKYGWASMGKDDTGRSCLRIYSNNFFDAIMADQTAHWLGYAAIIFIVAEMT